ncbi:hypothetical protein OROHE_003673 [Orobanche hederae]
MLPPFQSSIASSPFRPPPSLHASTAPPPSLSASTAPRNDPSDPTHNNHQTRDPNLDAPKPASNLNKPTTTTPSATSGLSPTKSRFQRSHKILDPYSKRRLELNDCAGIPMNKNFHSLVVEARGYENLQFNERDCRNYIAKVR